MRVGIAVQESRVSAVAVRRGRIVWAAESDYSGSADLARVLGALAAERPRGSRDARVALAAGLVRIKTVEGLPPLSRQHLAAHVRLNSRRYFLQNGIPLVTDAMPLRRVRDAPAQALLAGALVPLVEAVAAGIEASGMRCQLIAPVELMKDVPDDERELSDGMRFALRAALAHAVPLSLLPDSARAREDRDRRTSLGRWCTAAALSLVLAAASWFAGQVRVERSAQRELAVNKSSLESALSARRDLEATTEALALVATAEAGSPKRGRLLADLTRALPDSAFLVSLRLEGDGEGSLSGYAPHAAAILARLERGGLIRNAAFEGPVTREVIAGQELERFALRFRIPGPREPR